MQTQLMKWGNSVAVRLPKMMLEAAKLQVGDVVELEAASSPDSIVVRKKQRWPSIEERIAGITEENQHPEMEWGPPRGEEVW